MMEMNPVSEAPKGWLSEVFSSIQGEGLYCGARQLFIRLALCNLRCRYCDTPYSTNPPPAFTVEAIPGSGVFDSFDNPVDSAFLTQQLSRFRGIRHHSVSITGGEPLMQADFLRHLLKALKKEGMRIHLETNGTLYRQLESVIHLVDLVAMDMKLPSAAKTGELWDCHRKFLKIALKGSVFVKLVVTGETPLEELDMAGAVVAAQSRNIPVVIQPVTGLSGKPEISASRLLQIQNRLASSLQTVLVIPQTHRFIKGLL